MLSRQSIDMHYITFVKYDCDFAYKLILRYTKSIMGSRFLICDTVSKK